MAKIWGMGINGGHLSVKGSINLWQALVRSILEYGRYGVKNGGGRRTNPSGNGQGDLGARTVERRRTNPSRHGQAHSQMFQEDSKRSHVWRLGMVAIASSPRPEKIELLVSSSQYG